MKKLLASLVFIFTVSFSLFAQTSGPLSVSLSPEARFEVKFTSSDSSFKDDAETEISTDGNDDDKQFGMYTARFYILGQTNIAVYPAISLTWTELKNEAGDTIPFDVYIYETREGTVLGKYGDTLSAITNGVEVTVDDKERIRLTIPAEISGIDGGAIEGLRYFMHRIIVAVSESDYNKASNGHYESVFTMTVSEK